MKIFCSKCNGEIQSKDINIQKMVGHCIACNEVIRFDDCDKIVNTKPFGSKLSEVTLSGSTIGLLFPNRKSLCIFLIVFGGFWDLISSIILMTSFNGERNHDVFAIVFILMFFIAGFGIMGAGILQLCVRTALIVDDKSIKLVKALFGWERVRGCLAFIGRLHY